MTVSSAGDTRLGMRGCWGHEDPEGSGQAGRGRAVLPCTSAQLGKSLACTRNGRNSAGTLQGQRILCCLSLVSKAKQVEDLGGKNHQKPG